MTPRRVPSSRTKADGSPPAAYASAGGGKGNVGIAAGIGVGDLHNDADVRDTAVSGITAGSLAVKATMGSLERTLGFDQTDIDAAKGTFNLTGGAHGLRNGDQVVYHQGTVAIPELTNGTSYYVVLKDDGKIQLSTHADGSSPISSLTDPGAGAKDYSFTFTETDSRLGVTAVAGASGGDTT